MLLFMKSGPVQMSHGAPQRNEFLETPDENTALVNHPSSTLSKGLIVREPWISALLNGSKTWELRASATRLRGRIGLIASGTGKVVGEIDVVGVVGPLTLAELTDNEARHLVAIGKSSQIRYNTIYAWVVANPHRYEEPIPYSHPPGAVIWVNLG